MNAPAKISAAAAFPIPELALAQHIALLGKTGSGKTSTGKLIIEHVVEEDYRVCVLDPIKSDWWGITSSADGKRPGLPFAILGGPRAHAPLPPKSGRQLAELVASGKLPLSIIDMADFRPGQHQAFFTEFAETLLRKIKGIVYLVMEEAHFFAPKEQAGISGENLAIYWAKMLATAGRSKGIRLLVMTQRTQALHNAVLGSCDTAIVHRLTAPADQKPVKDWLKANVSDAEIIKRISDGMSSIKTGSGYLCAGEAKVFEFIQWPRIKTFDNSATPTKQGSGSQIVKTAAIDLDALKQLLGEAADEVASNDPAALRKEIERLKRERAGLQNSANAQTAPATLSKEERQAIKDEGFEEGFGAGFDAGHAEGKAEGFADAIGKTRDALDAVQLKLPPATPSKRPQPKAIAKAAPRIEPPRAATPRNVTAQAGDASLTGPQRSLLEALIWWAALGHSAPTRAQVAGKVGWKVSGSNLRNRLADLSGLGFITYPQAGRIALTPEGEQAAPTPDMSQGLLDALRAQMTGPQRALFDILAAEAAPLSKIEIGERIGWEPGGSNLRNRLADLSGMEVISYPAPGVVELQPWVLEHV